MLRSLASFSISFAPSRRRRRMQLRWVTCKLSLMLHHPVENYASAGRVADAVVVDGVVA